MLRVWATEHQPPKETIPIQSENLAGKERGRFPVRAAPFVTSREDSRTWKGRDPRKGRRRISWIRMENRMI